MVPGGSLSTYLLAALVRVMGKTRSMTASCDTLRMSNKLTISKTHSICSWASSFFRKARIAQSSALPTVADEPASPGRDDSQGEACPTDSGFIADQDRATIAKSSTLPRNSAPRVTSPAAEECSMQ
uniref:Uncharacterized protein n=1 Tax=Tanacetum cinerariifolium TaxID=118510 RepID=A0A6L2KJ53_TANCI|nr:hypothetical protein [Tanacetum cinerariifolium]